MKLVLIGWGAIGQTAAQLLTEQPVQGVAIEIVGVATRDASARNDLPTTATHITDPGELAALDPDVVAEAAGRDSVGPWGAAALKAGADFIVSSVSALADPALLESLREIAIKNACQIRIQPGALGGIDALAAARLMGIDAVEHRIVKPPAAWKGTPAETLCDLGSLTKAQEFYAASAAETAKAFPKNANVAMTTALAGIGPDRTTITLVADPRATTNQHMVSAHGAFGRLDVSILNNPLPANPKTSAMAALNLVRSIQNDIAAIAI